MATGVDMFSLQENRVVLVAVVQKGSLYTKIGSGLLITIR